MSLRGLSAAVASAVLLVLAGCAGRGPMTEKEFMGFCSSSGDKRGGCDSLGLCDEYLQTVGKPQPSLQACLRGCEKVRRDLAGKNRSGRCQGTVKAGSDWCQSYCRTLYPE